ncbi:DMT family transporter [Amorphus coralli]|uniref:DMT family transporter n=1 Tax=Amorphus coralli TaxID=340680 RepID=UPI00037030C0|nr:DMT family transporter [Amorphus coralli]
MRALGRLIYGQPYLLLTVTAMMWGGNIVVGRFAVGKVPPVALAQFRWTAAFLIILPFALTALRQDWPHIRRNLPMLALLSLTGVTLYNALIYTGLEYTEALNGALLQSVQPLMIALFALILYGDRLTRFQITGIAVSFVGVVLIISAGNPITLLELEINPGDAIIVVALGIYGFYSALLKARPQMHPMSFLAVIFFLGSVMLMPAFLWEWSSGARPENTPGAWFALFYVAIFPSVVANFCFNRGVELVGPNRAGPFFHLIPVFGSIAAILFLGEEPAWYHGVGWVLIAGGIVVSQRTRGFARSPR